MGVYCRHRTPLLGRTEPLPCRKAVTENDDTCAMLCWDVPDFAEKLQHPSQIL